MNNRDVISDIELLIYDCDGVLTDNKVIVDENGKESVVFNRGDGFAISKIKKDLGIKQIIISTEKNPIIIKRCEKLNIEAINGIEDKEQMVKSYCDNNGIDLRHVMFIGNDLNDKCAMEIVGFTGCPLDAEYEIKTISNWISEKKGGDGVIRDLYRCLTKG